MVSRWRTRGLKDCQSPAVITLVGGNIPLLDLLAPLEATLSPQTPVPSRRVSFPSFPAERLQVGHQLAEHAVRRRAFRAWRASESAHSPRRGWGRCCGQRPCHGDVVIKVLELDRPGVRSCSATHRLCLLPRWLASYTPRPDGLSCTVRIKPTCRIEPLGRGSGTV